VEQEIIRKSRIALSFLGLTLAMNPTWGRAHGINFLLVKATPGAGQLRLEITADYTDNPLIDDAIKAEAVIREMLHLKVGNSTTAVGAATGFTFQASTRLDPTCPIPLETTKDAAEHRLLIGTTTEPIAAQEAVLSILPGNPHDVIYWTVPSAGASQNGYLIAGESTSAIPIPTEVASDKLTVPARSWLLISLVICFLLLAVRVRKRFAAR
jgi:hypothetical protein